MPEIRYKLHTKAENNLLEDFNNNKKHVAISTNDSLIHVSYQTGELENPLKFDKCPEVAHTSIRV